jgi:hypothetical protein
MKRRSKQEPISAVDYFNRRGVFRYEEFMAAYVDSGRTSATAQSTLKHHVAQATLLNLRRGLYGLANTWLDPLTLACKLAPDAVVAYDGAATLFGLLELQNSMTLLSSQRIGDFVHSEVVYRRVAAKAPREEDQVLKVSRGYNDIWVTSRERTLVDLLDRIDLGPGIDDVWQAFRKAGPLDGEALVKRARKIDSHTTAARLGFFLENLGPAYQHVLPALESLRPPSPLYFHRADREGHHSLIPRWNLVANHDFILSVERPNQVGPRKGRANLPGR